MSSKRKKSKSSAKPAVAVAEPPAPEHRMRRHREDALIPTLLVPVDLPDDAAGRIEVVKWTIPEEPVAPDQSLRVPAPPPTLQTKLRGALLPPGAAGWIPVLMLAVILALTYAVGLRITH